jgi:cyanophycinase-like exopeptidase
VDPTVEASAPVADATFALLGSGEFEPWTREADERLLAAASGDGSILILPTASAPEGDEVFDRWGRMGVAHYERGGVAARVVPLKTRNDAERGDLAADVEEVSAVFFSGGNPAYLARVLSGTPFWDAVRAGLARGMAYAGCSAGIASLGRTALDSATRDGSGNGFWQPGLELFPGLWLAPHWDGVDRYAPGLRDLMVASLRPGERLLGIDERTAVVGRDGEWTVVGAGAAELIDGRSRRTYRGGEDFADTFLNGRVSD